jgi:Tfp pilus assembly protein PilF
LGSEYLRDGRYHDAVKKLERSIMEWPDDAGSRVRLSMAYFFTGQAALAGSLARSALKVRKSDYLARLCLALYYAVDGDNDRLEEMLRALRRSRRGQPDEDAHELFGRMLELAPLGDETRGRLLSCAMRLAQPKPENSRKSVKQQGT